LLEEAPHGRFLALRNLPPKRRHLPEEVLHPAGRLEEDEHLPLALAHLGEGVGDPARRESRVARAEPHGLVADPHDEVAADYVEPFVLEVVAVERRAAL